jgi:hypothetical protein
VVPHLGSTNVPSHPILQRLNIWSSWVKENGITQVMYIAKLKDCPKGVKKTFSMTLKRVFEMVWWRGENGITSKRIFDVEVFFSSQNIDFPFYLKRLLELFFFLCFSCSVSWGLRGFDDIWGGNHFLKNFFSNGFNILAVDAYSGMELSMPTCLKYDYGDGGVVNIMAVDAYSGVEICTLIFLGEASKFFWVANHFWNFFQTQMDTFLNKAQHKQEFLCG